MKLFGFDLRNNPHIRLNVILIIVSVLIAALIVGISLGAVIDRDRELMTRLIFTGLYDSIQNEFDRPLGVVRTMACDKFLLQYIKDEKKLPE